MSCFLLFIITIVLVLCSYPSPPGTFGLHFGSANSVKNTIHNVSSTSLFPPVFYSKDWFKGKLLYHTMPSACIVSAIVLGLTVALRWNISPTTVPTIAQQVMIGVLLGKSLLGRKSILGPYYEIYAKLVSLETLHTLGVVGALGFVFCVFLAGIKTDINIKPNILEIVMGILSPSAPFVVGWLVEALISYIWELNKKETKAFQSIIYSVALPPYTTILFLLEDLDLSKTIMGQFVLTSSIISLLAVDGAVSVLKFVYSLYNHTQTTEGGAPTQTTEGGAPTQTTEGGALVPIYWTLGLILFVFLIFRPLVSLLLRSNTYSEARNITMWVIIACTLGTQMFSGWLESYGLLPTLLFGLAVPRAPELVNLLVNHINAIANALFLLYLTLLSMQADIFSINFKDSQTILCVVLIIVTGTTRFLTCWLVSNFESNYWRRKWAIVLSMMGKGGVELSLYATLRDQQAISDGIFALLIVYILVVNFITTTIGAFYHPHHNRGSPPSTQHLDQD